MTRYSGSALLLLAAALSATALHAALADLVLADPTLPRHGLPRHGLRLHTVDTAPEWAGLTLGTSASLCLTVNGAGVVRLLLKISQATFSLRGIAWAQRAPVFDIAHGSWVNIGPNLTNHREIVVSIALNQPSYFNKTEVSYVHDAVCRSGGPENCTARRTPAT